MMIFQEPEFHGLFLVVSGGQCGADRGGLEAAFEMGVQTGGMAPKGWRTCRGPAPELARYGLIEHASPDYDNRTRHNISAADGTVIIVSNAQSPGSLYTANYARKIAKPCLTLYVYEDDTHDMWRNHGHTLSAWIEDNRCGVLNVAGNRDKYGSQFHHVAAKHIIESALLDLHNRGFLVSRA